MSDFRETVRRSMKRDFERASIYQPKNEGTVRVREIDDRSNYAAYKRFFIGKLMKIMGRSEFGGYWVEFVFENDRDALCRAANWKSKQRFLLDFAKFEN